MRLQRSTGLAFLFESSKQAKQSSRQILRQALKQKRRPTLALCEPGASSPTSAANVRVRLDSAPLGWYLFLSLSLLGPCGPSFSHLRGTAKERQSRAISIKANSLLTTFLMEAPVGGGHNRPPSRGGEGAIAHRFVLLRRCEGFFSLYLLRPKKNANLQNIDF